MSDPKRLVDDDASEALVAMLSAAEADVLDPAAVERVRLGVARGLGNGGGGSGAGGSVRGAARWLLRLGIPVGVVTVGAVVALRPAPPRVEGRPTVVAAPPSAAPEETAAPFASAGPSPVSGVDNVSVAPSAAPGRAFRPRAVPAPSPSLTTAPPSPPREGTLLLEARRALATDPARALDLVEAHAREFPNSQLTPERERIRAEAEKRMAP
jgi:hypothetical protein